MSSAPLTRFWRLLQAEPTANVFNPWIQRDAGTDGAREAPRERLARLKAHLAAPIEVILLGEAPGLRASLSEETLPASVAIMDNTGRLTRDLFRHDPHASAARTSQAAAASV
jgi:hypothetical protein